MQRVWRQTAVVWVIAVVGLALALLLLSEGEPICSGPLILDVDDSDPPQCDDPSAGLVASAPALLAVGLLVAGVYAAVASAVTSRRRGQPGRGR